MARCRTLISQHRRRRQQQNEIMFAEKQAGQTARKEKTRNAVANAAAPHSSRFLQASTNPAPASSHNGAFCFRMGRKFPVKFDSPRRVNPPKRTGAHTERPEPEFGKTPPPRAAARQRKGQPPPARNAPNFTIRPRPSRHSWPPRRARRKLRTERLLLHQNARPNSSPLHTRSACATRRPASPAAACRPGEQHHEVRGVRFHAQHAGAG